VTEGQAYLRRIPVRQGADIVLVAVRHIASIIANRETLHVTTNGGERYTIGCRLKDVEARLDPASFVRVSRRAIVAIDAIRHITPARTGGTYSMLLGNDQTVAVSRLQGRLLRDRLLTL
jgi:DNA-binding LytR/AlgR family response regulator